MSAPPSPTRRQSFLELSNSRANNTPKKPGIRLIPYSPPRLDDPESSPDAFSPASPHSSQSPPPQHNLSSSLSSRPRLTPWPSDLGVVSEYSTRDLSPETPADATRTAPIVRRDTAAGDNYPPSRRHNGPFSSGSDDSDNEDYDNDHDSDNDDDDDYYRNLKSNTVSAPRPLTRRRKAVAVHGDKTFSLVPLSGSTGSRVPPSHSSLRSHDRLTLDTYSDRPAPSSPPTTLPETCDSARSNSPLSQAILLPAASSSPQNYRMVGGLRKVPQTPVLRRARSISDSVTVVHQSPLADLPSPFSSASPDLYRDLDTPTKRPVTSALVNKPSLQSVGSESITSERTNYNIYGTSSPDHHFTAITTVKKQPTPSSPVLSVDDEDSDVDNQNYVLHGASPNISPQSSTAVATTGPKGKQLASRFSRESLTVPPLRPKPTKQSSLERLNFHRSRSRESLRTVGSLSSLSSYFAQEAIHSFLSMPSPVHLSSGTRKSAANSQPYHPSRAIHGDPLSSIEEPSESAMTQPSSPHQWSPQVSTIVSESENGSSPQSQPPSRTPSLVAALDRRRSSGYLSNYSRRRLSVSSSFLGASEGVTLSRSRSTASLDVAGSLPRPAYQINYQDEDGDGLADLRELHHRPSRAHLSTLSNVSDQVLGSATNSRSRGNSLVSVVIPAWARLYYGSGERRLLAPSSESLYSAFRAGAATVGVNQIPQKSPDYRNRQSEANAALNHPSPSSSPSSPSTDTPISTDPDRPPSQQHPYSTNLVVRKQTSSVWSPHLRHDRRVSRYGNWDPPSMTWSNESSLVRGWNVQFLCFIIGFIFPFAWMIASFLPLPPHPDSEKSPAGTYDGDDGSPSFPIDPERNCIRHATMNDLICRKARWWRQVNRCMSVLGLFVIAAVISLAIVGVRGGWGRHDS